MVYMAGNIAGAEASIAMFATVLGVGIQRFSRLRRAPTPSRR